MDFSFRIDGLDAVSQAGQKLQKAVADEVNKGVYASAQKVATDYKKSVLEGGKSGRVYRRGAVSHTASAPGEAPASDTGRLVNAISVQLDGALAAIMKVATKYALMLEFGTTRMAARPAAIPALEKNRGWITDRLAQALRNAIERSGK